MKKKEFKEEFINRYKYLYENAVYILAPYVNLQEKEESDDKEEFLEVNNMKICLKDLPNNLLADLESFLLGDVPYNESNLYIDLESKKKNSVFLSEVKDSLGLLEVEDDKSIGLSFKSQLDIWNVLLKVRDFVNDDADDLINRGKKLESLDEYFRISRYKNDGKVWTSGYSLNYIDMINNSLPALPINKRKTKSSKNDSFLKSGEFVSYLSNYYNHYTDNLSVLTEREKQDIYLLYHDELPWNLETNCKFDDGYYPLVLETSLERPQHTKPCGIPFYVKEEEIFIDNNNKFLCRYFQLCPHCGYIVNIPKDILSDGIRKRINDNCSKDPNLFRKKYLYSELFSLDKSSSDEQKILLKKINN